MKKNEITRRLKRLLRDVREAKRGTLPRGWDAIEEGIQRMLRDLESASLSEESRRRVRLPELLPKRRQRGRA